VTGFAVLLRKELTEQWRTARLPVMAVIFLVIGLGSPLLAKYTPEIVKAASGSVHIAIPTPTMADAVAQLTKNLTQFAAIAAILLAMGSVAGEKESGTAAFVLTKPATRLAFLVAKFGGLAVTLLVAVAASGAGAYLYTAVLFATPPALGFVAACLVLLLGPLELAAVTLLGSTLVRSAIPAAGLGLVGLVAGATVAAIPNAGRYSPFGMGTLANDLAAGRTVVWSDWGWPLVVNVAIVVVALAASWVAFRRQEL
jgi:ABC-2 type transport system permease protein